MKSPEARPRLPVFEAVLAGEEGGRPFSSQELAGKVWVADFIFTNCGGPCPVITDKMAGLQKSLPPEIKLVSVSVDPERDTPEVLARYAATFDADPKRWLFLRLDKGALYHLVFEGFRLPLAEDPSAPSRARVTHSTKFVLVDGVGEVRGYYDSNGDAFPGDLEKDARRLLKETTS
jgi:cytochrome oxidase Cu insertion factor (SCO1/SenC/PrrC family)